MSRHKTHLHIYICNTCNIDICIHEHTGMYTYAHTDMHTNEHTVTNVIVHMHTLGHTHTCRHTQLHTETHLHTYTHTYTLKQAHTGTQRLSSSFSLAAFQTQLPDPVVNVDKGWATQQTVSTFTQMSGGRIINTVLCPITPSSPWMRLCKNNYLDITCTSSLPNQILLIHRFIFRVISLVQWCLCLPHVSEDLLP